MAKSAAKKGAKAGKAPASQPAPADEGASRTDADIATTTGDGGPTPEPAAPVRRVAPPSGADPEIPPGFMRGTLSGSYNYLNRWYGPGIDMLFPKGLGYTLGIPGSAS